MQTHNQASSPPPPPGISPKLQITVLCLNVHVEMQLAHTSARVPKKLPVKKKDTKKLTDRHTPQKKHAPYTRASNYRVYQAAGTSRASQRKSPKTFSTYPLPVPNPRMLDFYHF